MEPATDQPVPIPRRTPPAATAGADPDSPPDAPAPVVAGSAATLYLFQSFSPALALAVVTALLPLVFGNWTDYDTFWHLELGRNMVLRGRAPSPDYLSWSAAGRPYLAHSQLVDTLFYLLWSLGGFKALAVFALLGYTAVLLPAALLLGRLRLRPLVEVVAMALVFLTDRAFMGTRPHVLAFAIFGWMALAVFRPFTWGRAVLSAVLLAAWINIHATFHVGLLLLGVAASSWLWQRDVRSAALVGAAMVAGALGTLTAPGGVEVWLYPFRTVSTAAMARNIDWVSLRPLTQQQFAMGLLVVLAVSVGLWRVRAPLDLTALALLLPAVQLARFDPFAAPLLARGSFERLRERFPLLADPYAASPRRSAAAWGLLVAGLLVCSVLIPGKPDVNIVVPLPERATDRLLQCGTPSPIWNDYNWGGYIAWRSDGAYKLSIDGRAEALYPEAVMDDYLRVLDQRPGWQAIVQSSPAKYSITAKPSPPPVETLPGWRKVYEDDVAVIAARDNAVWRCP